MVTGHDMFTDAARWYVGSDTFFRPLLTDLCCNHFLTKGWWLLFGFKAAAQKVLEMLNKEAFIFLREG